MASKHSPQQPRHRLSPPLPKADAAGGNLLFKSDGSGSCW